MARFKTIGGTLVGAAVLLAILLGTVRPPALAGETHHVIIEKFAFVPANLTITQGDTVEFINRDIAPHTATEDETRWDTGEVLKGRSVLVEFTETGTSRYHCAFHPHMKAEVVVAPD